MGKRKTWTKPLQLLDGVGDRQPLTARKAVAFSFGFRMVENTVRHYNT